MGSGGNMVLLMLYHILGFILQTIPVVILYFVGRNNEDLKLGKGRCISIITMAICVFSIIFAAVSILPKWKKPYVISNCYMFGVILFTFIFIMFLERRKTLAAAVVYLLCAHYAAFVFISNNLVISTMGISLTEGILWAFGWDTIVAYFITYSVTYFWAYRFMKNYVKKSLAIMEKKELHNAVFYVFLVMIAHVSCIQILIINLDRHKYWVIFWTMVMVIIVYKIFFGEVNFVREEMKLKEKLKAFDYQYQKIAGEINNVKKIQHDLRHHLSVISKLNNEGDQKGIAEYLEKYEIIYSGIGEACFSNDPAIDTVLVYYKAMAEKEDIHVEIKIEMPNPSHIDMMDMTVLLGNMFENAIEACREIPKGFDRNIMIHMGMSGTSLLILLKNSCRMQRFRVEEGFHPFNYFLSGKPDGQGGQGLKSISEIAEKYYGTSEFCRKQDVFITRVVLNKTNII